MLDKVFDLLKDLLDNDTLIIIFLFIMAVALGIKEISIAVASGYLGYIKGRSKNGS